MTKEAFMQASDKVLMQTYKRMPVVFTSGKGRTLVDSEGNEYLDMMGGLAACGLGHCPDVLVKTIQEQAAKLIHVTNYFYNEPQLELAKLLTENSFGDKVFFANSGTEANEGAIKLARKYAFTHYGPEKYEIIAMTGSFHGRSLATLSVTNNDAYKVGLEPLPKGFTFTPFNDEAVLERAITPNTCAIMLEPLQGEGGITPATPSFMKKVRALADQHNLLMIVDEIQCGFGRTGTLFAYEQYDVIPDIMSLAKSMAGGFPIGAIVATDQVASAWKPGDHGTTFGGNPLACAAGAAVVAEIINTGIKDKAAAGGAYFLEKLEKLVDKYAFIKRTKGKGLMVGLELDFPGAGVVTSAFEKGLIINCTAGNILRFVPPMNITKEELDFCVKVLDEVFSEIQE
ncbi:MAG: aspartate aminotransferase family protein [Bacillota bacterium]|nr:aspartate aminotransferase family protein [Bacillota bacterium]MDW7677540.1 aspartate aminotransferase family protein [Bacillota bacterium]